MEGSGAGLGGGDAGAQGQAAEAQQQGPDLGQLTAGLESLQSGQEELRQFLMSAPWEQAVEQVQEQDPELDLSFLMPQQEPDSQELARQLSETLNQATSQQLQQQLDQHLNPVREQLNDMRTQMEVAQLVQEFPELAEPEVAQRIAGRGGIAEQMAEQLGQPALAQQPAFWRMAYMAARAADMANEEGADAPPAAHLEGGGGAMPGSQQVDLAAQIVGAREGRKVLPFLWQPHDHEGRVHGWNHFD